MVWCGVQNACDDCSSCAAEAMMGWEVESESASCIETTPGPINNYQ